MDINNLTYKVIGSAYRVHNTLGPGFLEKVYENALKLELKTQGIFVRQQPGSLSITKDIKLVSIIPTCASIVS